MCLVCFNLHAQAHTHTRARLLVYVKETLGRLQRKLVIVGDGVVVGDKGSAEGRTRAGPSLDTLS